MRLTDVYDGGVHPFEGDLTIRLLSIPAGALITAVTMRVEPLSADATKPFVEVLTSVSGSMWSWGATSASGTTGGLPWFEIDLHARRTLAHIKGSSIDTASLQVDLGGAYVQIGTKGTVLSPPDTPLTLGSDDLDLPGLLVTKLKLTNPSGGSPPDVLALSVRSVPTNVSLKLGDQAAFWTHPGEMTLATTTPDFTKALQAFLTGAKVVNGYAVVPLTVHSDLIARLRLVVTVDFQVATSLIPAGLKSVTQQYDQSTLAMTPQRGAPVPNADALMLRFPPGTQAASAATAVTVRGAFDDTRVARGPTGVVDTSASAPRARISSAFSPAQYLPPDQGIAIVATDLLLRSVTASASLLLDVRADADGKPDRQSALAKPVPFQISQNIDPQRAAWVTVALPADLHMNPQQPYWLVIHSVNGEAEWLGAPGASTPPAQSTLDGGLSWRTLGSFEPLSRLRYRPTRFEVPIAFQVEDGKPVALDQFQALGKVDFALDPAAVARAVNDQLSTAPGASGVSGEALTNGAFTDWTITGTTPGSPINVVLSGVNTTTPKPVALAPAPDGRAVYVLANIDVPGEDVLIRVATDCDRQTRSLVLPSSGNLALCLSPDGARAYVLGGGHLQVTLGVVDLATGTTGDQVSFPVRALSTMSAAIGPDGRFIYVATGAAVLVIDVSGTGAPTASTLAKTSSAISVAISADGGRLYVGATGDTLAVFDTTTNAPVGAPLTPGLAPSAIAVTPDMTLAVVADSAKQTFAVIDLVRGMAVPTTAAIAAAAAVSFPVAVVISPDGATAFVAGSFKTSGVVAVDLVHRTTTDMGAFANIAAEALAITPQGDRLYVISDGFVVAVPLGVRIPTDWALTPGMPSGAITIGCLETLGAHAVKLASTNGAATTTALSQVVPAAPSVRYALSFWGAATTSADGRAEVFWRDASRALLRTDTTTIANPDPLTLLRTLAMSPPNAAQAELRFSVTRGTLTIAAASLFANPGPLANGDFRQSIGGAGDAWQLRPPGQVGTVAVRTPDGVLVRSAGPDAAILYQSIAVTAGQQVTLAVDCAAARGAPAAGPRIEVHWLNAAGAEIMPAATADVGPLDFPTHHLATTAPDGATQAEIQLVAPAGMSFAVRDVALDAAASVAMAFRFIAQAPGALSINVGSIGLTTAPPKQPPVPSGGLAPPTPPADAACPCCACCGSTTTASSSTPAVTVSGRAVSLSTCPDCGATRLDYGGAAAPAAPIVSLARLALAAPSAPRTWPSVISPQAPEAAAPPAPEPSPPLTLTDVPGVGPAYARRLLDAGIDSIQKLAEASSDDVKAAIRNVSIGQAADLIAAAGQLLR